MEELTLDGNAAAGVLGEVFAFEVTMAWGRCAVCGATERVGGLPTYTQAPGLVVRCRRCNNVLIRLVQGSGRYWLDLRGMRHLEVEEP